jgi:hypothetical protein
MLMRGGRCYAATRGFTARSISFSLVCRATRNSYFFWRFIQNSGVVPKYRPKRSAVPAVMPRLPRKISLNRGVSTDSALELIDAQTERFEQILPPAATRGQDDLRARLSGCASQLRTGDEGFLDADGALTLTGRLREIINSCGEKISERSFFHQHSKRCQRRVGVIPGLNFSSHQDHAVL